MVKATKRRISKLLQVKPQLFFVIGIKLVTTLVEVLFIFLSIYAFSGNKRVIGIFFNGFSDTMASARESNEVAFCIICCLLMFSILVVNIPVNYGICQFISRIKEKKLPKYEDVFYYYTTPRLLAKALVFYVAFVLRIMFFAMLFLVPVTIIFVFFCIKMQTAKESEKFILSFAVLVSSIFTVLGTTLFAKNALKCIFMPFFQVMNNRRASWLTSAFSKKLKL